jgi:2-haloacid dehalogenase
MSSSRGLRVDGILFDLLSALLDSWSFWDRIAGNPESGRLWRLRYLDLSYRVGPYRPFEALVAQAAGEVGLPESLALEMVDQWDDLRPWPEASQVLASLGRHKMGVVTNCSEVLGHRAAKQVGIPFPVVVSAERAGAYKPNPEPYRLALRELDLPPERVLYVAGSPYDVEGASGVGLRVFWHNRAGLTASGASRASRMAQTLTELCSWLDSGMMS